MKKILYYILLGGLILNITSCDDFLTTEPSDSIEDSNAFTTLSDFKNNLYGAYSTLGETGLLGRDILCFGDLLGDACYHNQNSYNFRPLAIWNVTSTDSDLGYVWEYGYEVIDRTARIIEAGADSTSTTMYGYQAQAHALRAWTTFYLTNIFGLPYTYSSTGLGVVNVDSPVEVGETVSRSTVAENYAFILEDIAAAEEYYSNSNVTDPGQFYFNKAAVYALDARVNLFMGNYTEARIAALEAIDLFGGSLAETSDDYSAEWTSSELSDEDIMRFERSATQTTSMHSMWGTLGARFVDDVLAELPETDIRYDILNNNSTYGKFVGTDEGTGALSIPMFRLAEMYLTVAECYAEEGNYEDAGTYLAIVSDARNSEFSGNIATDATILSQIQEERKWETIQEGFRYFDARRWLLSIDVDGGSYSDFAVYKFCHPIPDDEVNSGYGVEQTENWDDYLPE